MAPRDSELEVICSAYNCKVATVSISTAGTLRTDDQCNRAAQLALGVIPCIQHRTVEIADARDGSSTEAIL